MWTLYEAKDASQKKSYMDADADAVIHYIDLELAVNYVKAHTFDAEQFFGGSSTYTPFDAPSDESQWQLSATLPSGIDALSNKKRVTKRNTKSGIWKFFEIYKDPKIQNMTFYLLCKKMSTTPLLYVPPGQSFEKFW